MLFFLFHFKKIITNSVASIFISFFIISFMFYLYMIEIENLSYIDAYYFIITTATTVGYGDFSPQTNLGKIFVTLYMVFGISILGLILGLLSESIYNKISLKNKGLSKMKNKVDLLIVGFPNEEKIVRILEELRADEVFKYKNIVLLNNQLDEIPESLKIFNIKFIKGVPSDSSVLERCNIHNTEKALILAKDIYKKESDDYTTSTVAVIEKMNSNVYTIAEKVRKDNILFETTNCDLVLKVSSPEILSQEILNEGAAELEETIFSNKVEGTQFNIQYQNEECCWKDIKIKNIDVDIILEGFKNPNDRKFNLLPNNQSIIETNAMIKYRSIKRINHLK